MTGNNESSKALVTGRIFSTTPQAIFAAFEDAEKLAQWWGPDGFTSTFEIFEFRPDGRWLFVMHGPNGVDYKNDSYFREVIRDQQIVIEHVVEPLFTLTATIEPRGDNQTYLSWVQEFANIETAEKVRSYAGKANEQVLDRLGSVLSAGA